MSASDSPAPPVVHESEVSWEPFAHGERFRFRRKKLAAAAGGGKLGCSLVEVPPGRRSWPRHYHCANEEAIYVLAGRGRAVIGDREIAVEPGSYVALRCRADEAHQMVNDGDAPLRYLCFSTMIAPDVAVYADSDKFAVFCGTPPGGDKAKRTFQAIVPLSAQVDYWHGEPEEP